MRSSQTFEGSQRSSMRWGLAVLATVVALTVVYRIEQLSWLEAAVAAIGFVAPCVLLGRVVWRLLLRRKRDEPVLHALALHVVTAVAFSAAWVSAFCVLVYFSHPEWLTPFLSDGAVWQFAWGLIGYGVLAYAAEIQARLREKELAATKAELLALRAQLNPHFLFNTLHSLTQLAREDPVATQDALEQFGELMRYVLNVERDAMAEVSLEQELHFVRNYLAIEKLRLCHRLRVEEDIDPESLELAIPPLLLQPLVENAVRHGVAPRREGATIRLSTRLSSSHLLIEVADDGNGAQPDVLSRASGLGLSAVARQLKARFPHTSALDVITQPRTGFTVKLQLPVRV
ncbi:MAG TPA: histidine kinase [Steroidobacter sp.]|uniref:sensor histidine kinase n=1 Tax=Steroidobacter sp. TaxID=1978227 RepID=UPI002ED9B94E